VTNRYKSNYDKSPVVVIDERKVIISGWDSIISKIKEGQSQKIVIECYHGVAVSLIISKLKSYFSEGIIFSTERGFRQEALMDEFLEPFLTEDRIFGRMNDLNLGVYFDDSELNKMRKEWRQVKGVKIAIGVGASLLCLDPDLFIYADMPRWEIQKKLRKGVLGNIGASNAGEDFFRLYKRAYFCDWRACDRMKQGTFSGWDFILDTTLHEKPKLLPVKNLVMGLEKCVQQPFRLVPFFDPGPWGGQWMKEVCDLDRSVINYAWCFDCVPEENSLLLKFGTEHIEIPAINLVFFQSEKLLGTHVINQFGKEFPIRFDFLDTMDGGNLSLQVHPLTGYIKKHFGMDYTQDESYYFLDAGEDAHVYLGLRDGIDPTAMMVDLENAQKGKMVFPTDKYVNKFSVKKHDHILIPAGTIHCSGKNSMVLEISATPYIFTFKLWDWGRLGLDGLPRPIHLDHGREAIQWDRNTHFAENELINAIEIINESDEVKEERTGLHALEFIETRRHWFSTKVSHHTEGNLNVLNLIEGSCALVESPTQSFEPFEVHFAETFIIPAAVGPYMISPSGDAIGSRCATIKAYIR
jgi:mannose-6-phosphate isomerase class I